MYTDPDMKRYLLAISVFFYLMIYLCILNTISSYQYLWLSSRRGHDRLRTAALGDVEMWERLRIVDSFLDISMYSFTY